MEYRAEDFSIECGCGKRHHTSVARVVVAPGALASLEEMAATCAPGAAMACVYDENTWQATAGRHPKAAQDIILPAAGLHADEHGVEALTERLDGSAGVLVAVGSGTVHDITRYVAAQRGLPFISAPTAASVDGFASSVAAMTLRGFKVTVPAVAPAMIAADTDVLRAAPLRLTRSGVGDILGKYVCLADWRIGHILTGEYHCAGLEGMVRQAVDAVATSLPGLAIGDAKAYERLAYALVLSGIAMQLAGNSRPASGAEHHISHLLELGVPWLGKNEYLHGEKVGVGTAVCAGFYHDFARLSAGDIASRFRPEASLAPEALQANFGLLAQEVQRENTPSCTAGLTAQALAEKWPEIQKEALAVPTAEQVQDMLAGIGAPNRPAGIGLNDTLLPRVLQAAPFVRNRLTLLRVAQLFSLA